MECAPGPGGMAPAQSCLPLSPGLGCPPLPPLSPGAMGPTWPSTAGMGLGVVVEVGVSGPGAHTPWHLGVAFKAAPFWPQAAGVQL